MSHDGWYSLHFIIRDEGSWSLILYRKSLYSRSEMCLYKRFVCEQKGASITPLFRPLITPKKNHFFTDILSPIRSWIRKATVDFLPPFSERFLTPKTCLLDFQNDEFFIYRAALPSPSEIQIQALHFVLKRFLNDSVPLQFSNYPKNRTTQFQWNISSWFQHKTKSRKSHFSETQFTFQFQSISTVSESIKPIRFYNIPLPENDTASSSQVSIFMTDLRA